LLFSKATWSIKVDAIPGSAPCDWLAGSHPNLVDYLSRRPAYLFIEAAGNNTTKCMRWPNGARVQHGSAELVRRYEAALTKIFDIAAHNDVRIVYVAPPPMYYREADIDNMKIADWVAHGPGHPGVIESDLPRLALSRDGHPSVFLRCEPNEGAKVGCYLDAIAVRQIDDPLHVHFCPFRKDVVAGFLCGVYSSGEHRWADAVDKLII
jgi:hypothetical protein